MWPRYETVVRPAFLRHAQAALDALQCGHGTRPRCVSCANLIRRSMVPLQCGHGTRPWCDRQSADAEDTDGDAAMWPRYETVVRRLSRPGTARDGSLQCGHGTRPWCDLTAPWLNDVDGNSCNVATVRDRGATRPGPARPAAAPRRCNVATVRDRGATLAELDSVSTFLQLQCGHGTRPWCDFHKSCPVAEFAAAMWPRYETVVRLGERALRAHGLGRCNVATVRDRGATCRLVAVRERGPGCNVATVRDRGATRSGRWPRRPPAGCNVATVRDRGATGHPPSAGRRPPGCNVATVRDRGATARRGGGDHGLRQAAMWPRYETVVRRAVVATGPRPRSCNVATVRDRGATWSATRRCLPTAAAMWPRYETVVRRRPRTLPSPPASCNVATVRDRGATAPAEFGNRPPPPSRERHRTPSAAPAEFGRLREPRVHGGWS